MLGNFLYIKEDKDTYSMDSFETHLNRKEHFRYKYVLQSRSNPKQEYVLLHKYHMNGIWVYATPKIYRELPKSLLTHLMLLGLVLEHIKGQKDGLHFVVRS